MILVRPYSQVAAVYDAALGVPWFRHARAAFERIVPRFGLAFRSAADVGCGTGLFASYLARRWRVPVFAVDRSPEMLLAAQRRCGCEPVRLLLQDARCLRLPHPVDLITAHYDMINHVTRPCDVREVFARVGQNLSPGGHFLFDVVTPRQPLSPARPFVRHLRRARPRVLQVVRWNPLLRLLRIDVVHWWKRGPSMERHWERAYSPLELVEWLRRAGFRIRAVLDALTLRIAGHEAPRVYVLAQKPVA